VIPEDVLASIRQRVDAGRNVGIIIGIVGRETERYFADGSTKGGGNSVPDEHTVFEIGSISKVFTGTLLADMVERHEVSLDDPVRRYLPESVSVPAWDGREITLGDLATHMSSLPRLPDNMPVADPSNPYADYTVDSLYAFLSRHELRREIGSEYEYSNLAVGLLGHVLSLRRGVSYEELLRSRILEPLALNETAITLSPSMQERLATGHAAGSPVSNWDIPTLAGAGAIRSTAHDMLRFLAANMNLPDAPAELRTDENPLASGMHQAQEIRADRVAGGMSVGLCWHIRHGNGLESIWHNGGTGGYRSFIGFTRGGDLGVVVLTNSTESVDDIGFHMLDPAYPLVRVEPTSFPDEVVVPPDVLESYVGTYQLTPEFAIVITLEDGRLNAQATGQPKFQIFASAENEFFWKVVDAQLTFNRASDGSVSGITLHQNGADLPGTRNQ